MLTLADIIEACTGFRQEIPQANPIVGAVIDSRQATKGSLFVAMKGERLDGHDFVTEAFANGAAVAFIEHEVAGDITVVDLRSPLALDDVSRLISSESVCLRVDNSLQALQQLARFWRRKLAVRVVGITGSVGKSTTKEVTAEILARRFKTLRNPGNLNNEIGLPITLLQLSEEHERAVLEMGFYVEGEIRFLCELALPSVGVITNIGTVHTERAGSREAIARGKSELVQALPADGVAILNFDDLLVRAMAEKTQARVFYYGMTSQADLWADQVEGLGLDGIRFALHYQNETLYLRVPMIGRHSVQTALRAAAVGLNEGLSWQEIIEGLHAGKSQLRLVTVRATSGALLLDDTYNASPESSLAALNLLNEMMGRKVAVLGDMLELGHYERRGHALVGLRAAEVVDELVTIGERGRQIALAARAGGLSQSAITSFDDVNNAIIYLKEHLNQENVVLVKGSHGMRLDRIVTALEEHP